MRNRPVGEVSPAVISPPLCTEAHQYVDDIAESDVSTGCRLFACGRGKCDFAQNGERHGEDRGIGLEDCAPWLQCTAIRLRSASITVTSAPKWIVAPC